MTHLADKLGLSRTLLTYGASSITASGVTFLLSLWVARIIGPSEFGKWNIINMCVLYGTFLQVGVLNGMGRQVPFLAGAGDATGSARAAGTAWTALVISSAIFLAAIVSIGGLFFPADAPVTTALLLLVAALYVGRSYQDFTRMYLRSVMDMDLLSVQLLISAALFFMVVPLSSRWGLPGFLAGQATAFAAASAIVQMRAGTRHGLMLRRDDLAELVRIGFPIYFAGVLYGLMTTIDRWVILASLDTTALGYYSLSITVLGIVALVPGVTSNYYYPRMSRAFGETGDPRALRPFVVKMLAANCAMAVPLWLFILLGLPPVVERLMPQYVPGIPALRISSTVGLLMPFALSFGDYLNVVGRQVQYLAILAAVLAINASCSIALVRFAGLGIVGAAWSTVATFAAYVLIMLVVSRGLLFAGPGRAPNE